MEERIDNDQQVEPKISKAVTVFKSPDVPAHKKKKVLEEDKFIEQLEQIIQRDFFPDLEKLKAQNAYLNAVENNDVHMLRELYSKYSQGKATPSVAPSLSTPSTFETPIDPPSSTPTHLPMESPSSSSTSTTSSTATSASKKPKVFLNQYLDNYTSEDNDSFQQMMQDADTKHRLKYSWLYGKEQEHSDKQQLALTLPSVESQCDYKKPYEVEGWKYTNKNYIMYVPDGAPLTPSELVELSKRQPQVIYANTRLKENPFKETEAEKSSETPAFKPPNKIGIDGKEIDIETPKINGYSFAKTPEPEPGVDASPFMTWGEIEGTPFRLDGGDTPITTSETKPYKMLEQTKRERIAMDLTEKVSQRYRDKKLKAIQVARGYLHSPKSTMSPAAMKLRSKLGTPVSDKALRDSYTPNRNRTPSSSARSTPVISTPKSILQSTPKTPANTDDLLNLPKNNKRPKAAEFF